MKDEEKPEEACLHFAFRLHQQHVDGNFVHAVKTKRASLVSLENSQARRITSR